MVGAFSEIPLISANIFADQDPLGHAPFDESDIMSDDEGDLDELASDVNMESDDMTDARSVTQFALVRCDWELRFVADSRNWTKNRP